MKFANRPSVSPPGSLFSPRRVGKTLLFGAFLGLGSFAAGCGDTQEQAASLPAIDTDAAFIAVPRPVSQEAKALRAQKLKIAANPEQAGTGDDFYLAINKRELTDPTNKWFLSGYIKQYFPGAVSYGAARSIGTRVVSFKQQNGKVFLFDTDNLKKTSDTFDPQVLVEAYPTVSYAPFDRLPGSSQFVLIDPSQGLNRFSMLSDAFAGGTQPDKFAIELSYLQRFRTLADGITFEQVFTGYGELWDPNNGANGEPNAFRASGTLGVGLRRYAETPGFKRGPIVTGGGMDVYFRGPTGLVPNTGNVTQSSIRWAVSAAKPITWVISNKVDILQEDPRFKGKVDLYAAMAKGVTNWNAVFGFEAFKVRKATADDSYADDDTNMILFDTDPSYGAAFANWRLNPNTSEIRGASVYFNSLWAEIGDLIFDDDPAMPVKALAQMDRPKVPMLYWDALGKDEPACNMLAPIYKGARPERDTARLPQIPGDVKLTRTQKIEQYITHVVLHEIGHTLGLRHNFKGSLGVDRAKGIVTSSVMDYVDDYDAILADKPGSFDTAVVKYLYGLSTALPTDKFCNDSGVSTDPDCAAYDIGANPYTETYLPNYVEILKDYLDNVDPTSPNNTLNTVLAYLRTATTVARLNQVWKDVIDQPGGYSLRVGKADATKLAMNPQYGPRIDLMGRRILARLYLDAANLRGSFTNDPPVEATFLADVTNEAKGQLSNTDGFRTVASRRVAADLLKKFQSDAAYKALREGSAKLSADLLAGKLVGDEAARGEDLLKYIDTKLLSPYFN